MRDTRGARLSEQQRKRNIYQLQKASDVSFNFFFLKQRIIISSSAGNNRFNFCSFRFCHFYILTFVFVFCTRCTFRYVFLHFQWWFSKVAFEKLSFLYFSKILCNILRAYEKLFFWLFLLEFCLILISRTCFDPILIYVIWRYGCCDSPDVVQVLITGLPLLCCHFNI